MNRTLYTHRFHGRIVQTPSGRRVAVTTLLREQRRADEAARLAAMLGKVVAGRSGEAYYVGTVEQTFSNGLAVRTRAGNRVEVNSAEETTFEKWDAAASDPENAGLVFLP